jgi:uncharacterized membrane protein (DUF2068 family)
VQYGPPMRKDASVSEAAPRETGIQVILAYKLAKAALWIALAALLVHFKATGRLDHFREVAWTLRHHLASRWSLELADALVAILSVKGVRIIEVGLVLDALLSAVEGYALWHGHRWGPWLVLLASAGPLPLELWEVAVKASPLRAALLAANVAIVAYLARWLRRHPRAPREPIGPGTP